MDAQEIGFRVLRARREIGLTQAELAEKARVNVATITRLERGQNAPTTDTLAAVAGALGRTLGSLLGSEAA